MALSYGFYNSVDGDRTYDAIQFGQIFDGIIKDGVYGTYLKGMVVIASENAGEVIIQPGRAWFNHTWSYNDANYVMAAEDPDVLLDRIDALVLDINTELAVRKNKFTWVTGEPSSNPRRPTLTNTVTHHQYPLCYVHRYPETTMIYDRDITNMVGTSECPFATGVLQGIDLDAWIRQWDDEFHNWEDATKTSFESWMLTQQDVYTAWYDAIKNQMEGDLTDFEDWFERIQGIIDEEAATHLQSEIDDLAAMLPAGSHITISTSETSLYLRNVTVSDGVHETTVKFDSSGVAVVESFPYVGLLTITSTDGQYTASTTLNTPYFGRYSASLSFWSATVNLDSDETLGGYTVTVKNSLDAPVISIVLNASGKGVFNATYPDTYKFVWTYGGDEMQVSLNVTEETTYSVEIYAGFNWRRWCELGGVSTYGMTSLQDVFDDEVATRKLMTIHASADYLIDRVSHNVNDIDEFTVNDTAMKWIGLRDYVCDGLTAISGVLAKFLASEYWERILKDHVPIMTSATAPYGTVIGSTTDSTYPAWLIFDGNDTTIGRVDNAANAYMGYKFTNPIRVCKLRAKALTEESPTYEPLSDLVIEGSNDNSTYIPLYTIEAGTILPEDYTLAFTNENYYLYYRIREATKGGSANKWGMYTLQFYGRSLNVSVPAMTSDTAPYGEVNASSSRSGKDPYTAFDGVDSTQWQAYNVQPPQYVGYHFTRKVAVKTILARMVSGRSFSWVFQGSNDGNTWIDLTDEEAVVMAASGWVNREPTKNFGEYEYYRIYFTAFDNFDSGKRYIDVSECNFYGVDYSEREFASGSTMKYLYDHGVELETLNESTYTNSYWGRGSVTKGSNEITITTPAKNYGCDGFRNDNAIDLTNYSLVRSRIGNAQFSDSSNDKIQIFIASNKDALDSGILGTVTFGNSGKSTNLPNSLSLDVSSINANGYVYCAMINSNAKSLVFKEIWLE